MQTKMSLATAEIGCTVSPRLSGAMEDCSVVRGPQLQRLCRQNCCMFGQRRMFGSMWSVVVVHVIWCGVIWILIVDAFSTNQSASVWTVSVRRLTRRLRVVVKCGGRCHSRTTTPTATSRTRGRGRTDRALHATLTRTVSTTATSVVPARSRRLPGSTEVTSSSTTSQGHERLSPASLHSSNDGPSLTISRLSSSSNCSLYLLFSNRCCLLHIVDMRKPVNKGCTLVSSDMVATVLTVLWVYSLIRAYVIWRYCVAQW